MNNFEWSLPTRIVYGPGQLSRLGELVKPYGKKVLFVTYQDKTGLTEIIEKAITFLKKEGLEVSVFDRIEPNPRTTTVDAGVKKLHEFKGDVLVAFGGGSVIDATKFISGTAFSGGSSWEYIINYWDSKPYTGAYPIVAVPTVSAAGSETNPAGVITNWETKEKSAKRSPYFYPKVALIDPEILASIPRSVTADTGVDIFSHLIEHYFTSPAESEITDRLTEGLALTLMEYLDRALKNGLDLEARGQIALSALLGWSGLQSLGRVGAISLHFIEHQVSAHYDISHGRGLAILFPAYLEYFAEAKPARWAKLNRRVFGAEGKDDLAVAKALSKNVVTWLRKIGMHLKFSDVGIGSEKFEQMADDVVRIAGQKDGKVPGPRPMDRSDILEIFRRSL
ncbi:MAG: iron-containing alcohol dehydrogenase [Thermodesulfobacteriota bacterium]